MPYLPLELLLNVVHSPELSGHDLRQLRAVNRTFHNLVCRDAFRKVAVTATVKSANGLLNILGTPAISTYVQEIESQEDMPPIGDDQDPAGVRAGMKQGGPQDWSELQSIMASAYSLLHQAPALHSIVFRFSPIFKEDARDYDDFEPSDELQLHWAMLGAIANNPIPLPALRSLALHNMLPFPGDTDDDDIYDTKPFAKIVGALHHLHICALGEELAEDAYHQDPLQNFWEQVLLRLLEPAKELRSLHIGSNIWVGAMPPLEFTLLAYPRLESLCLDGVLFDGQLPVVGTEDFVARHGKTLRRLELVGCAITHGFQIPERFWSMIWRRYEQELELLSELIVEFHREDPDSVRESPRTEPLLRYCVFLDGQGFIPDFVDVPGEEEDTAALSSLQAVVAGRRAATSSASTE
ncbi:hypothetical protein FA95DRAFT_1604656 [Auriscalpium vulgare]|uniref:Uncharacterized protein n=1 Tax=Auriscalpium vulgare TaxID=40419 RepID=A0ACB8RYM2_9AGAM|nr:hypothetical protein FA95DRAFT_1604656 [Auriscalpium vulgare]